ncbi:hypothetical protein RUM44_001221, partial [Polyplax serrata]
MVKSSGVQTTPFFDSKSTTLGETLEFFLDKPKPITLKLYDWIKGRSEDRPKRNEKANINVLKGNANKKIEKLTFDRQWTVKEEAKDTSQETGKNLTESEKTFYS